MMNIQLGADPVTHYILTSKTKTPEEHRKEPVGVDTTNRAAVFDPHQSS